MNISALRRYTGPAILVLGALFLGHFFLSNLGRLDAVLAAVTLSAGPLLLSLLLLLFNYPVSAAKWVLLYRWMDADPQPLEVFRIVVYYQISGYVPGVVPQFVTLGHYANKHGMSHQQTASALFIEEVSKVLGSLLLFGAFLAVSGTSALMGGAVLLLTLLGGVLLLTSPRIINAVLDRVLPLLGKESFAFTAAPRHILWMSGYAVGEKIIPGTAFYFMLHGLGFSVPWFDAVGLLAGAWVIGFLVLIVPGGLGVREGVLAYFLQQYVTLDSAVLIATFLRFWSTLPKLLILGVVLLHDRKEKITDIRAAPTAS